MHQKEFKKIVSNVQRADFGTQWFVVVVVAVVVVVVVVSVSWKAQLWPRDLILTVILYNNNNNNFL